MSDISAGQEIKRHPLYEKIARSLKNELGNTALDMSDDQDCHMVAFIAMGEVLTWLVEINL